MKNIKMRESVKFCIIAVLMYLGLFLFLYSTLGNARTCPNPYLRGSL